MFTELPQLTLYIHFPWCIRKCPYCDFNSHPLRGEIPEEQYVDQLIADFTKDAHLIQGRAIEAIFCGGGTPSLFSAKSLERLFSVIRKQASLAAHCEITLEANPGTIDEQHFKGYYDLGVNRLSLGVQSWHDARLQQLGRIHQSEHCHRAVDILKSIGFTNFNIDMMFGLPNQTTAEALHDLRLACDTGATHVSWYQLTLEPNTAFYQHPPENIPSEDTIWEIEQQGYQLLNNAGFKRYEVSAYAKNERLCQHNLNYWQFGDYLGIGAGAHSKITDQEQQSVTRYLKHKHPKIYLSATDFQQQATVIMANELSFEFMLNALRLMQPVRFELFESRTGLDRSVIFPVLHQLATDGFIQLGVAAFELTDLGKNFLNDVTAAFLKAGDNSALSTGTIS